MNDTLHNNPDFEPTREDVLIGRVVDGEASSADWEALERIALSEPGVWERLGRAQRVHARLEREVEDAIAIAELSELPRMHVASYSLSSRIRQYAGWAVAAVIGVAFLGTMGVIKTDRVGPVGNAASFGPASWTADEALERYLNKGKEQGVVVDEMPAKLVDARVSVDGRTKEVIFVRQIVERRSLSDLSVLSIEIDENGRERVFQQPVKAPAPAARDESPV